MTDLVVKRSTFLDCLDGRHARCPDWHEVVTTAPGGQRSYARVICSCPCHGEAERLPSARFYNMPGESLEEDG